MLFPIVFASTLCLFNPILASDIPSDLPTTELLKLATQHLASGSHNEALAYYDAAIHKDPSNYLTIFKRGAAYLSVGRSQSAERDFDRVLKLKPGFEGALIQRSRIRSRDGRWADAEADLITAGKQESGEMSELEEARGAEILAADAAKSNQWDDCVHQAGIAIRVAVGNIALRELRYQCRLENGDILSALTDLNHIVNLSGSPKLALQLSALTFFVSGETEKGLSLSRKCLQSDPDNKPCRTLMKQQKAMDKLLKKFSGFWEKGSYASALRLLIKTSEDEGLINECKSDFDILQKDGIIHAKAINGLHKDLVEKACQAYIELNKFPKAKPFCDEALENNSDSVYGLIAKAQSQLDKEEYEPAINTLKRAKEIQNIQKIQEMLNNATILLRRSKQKDYYKVLGVGRDADERQIKKAYRKLSKEYHPDKASANGIPKEDAEKKMAEINEAYETLKDPETKAKVDRGEDPNDPTQQHGGQPFQGSPFGFGQHGQQMFFKSGGQGGFPFGGGDGGGFKFHFG